MVSNYRREGVIVQIITTFLVVYNNILPTTMAVYTHSQGKKIKRVAKRVEHRLQNSRKDNKHGYCPAVMGYVYTVKLLFHNNM